MQEGEGVIILCFSELGGEGGGKNQVFWENGAILSNYLLVNYEKKICAPKKASDKNIYVVNGYHL